MRFGRRTAIVWSGQRWVLLRPIELKADERSAAVDGSAAASMVAAWCCDPMIWPDMLLLYEELSGDRLRPPSTLDVDTRIRPRLRAAFERGELRALRMRLFGRPERAAEEGIHGSQPEELPEPPIPPEVRRVARVVAEKTFLDVQIVDSEGEPLAGRRFKLQLPDGRSETGRLGPDGRVRKTNIDPGVAYLSLLDEEGPTVAADDVPADDVPAEDVPVDETSLETKVFTVRVVNVAGAPLSGLHVAFTSNGTRTVIPADDDGVAKFEAPAEPPPGVEIADPEQMSRVLEQRPSAEAG